MATTMGVYAITHDGSGCQYIGQSSDIHSRWTRHRSELRRNVHKNPLLQEAWNKYGEVSFTFSILEIVDYKIVECCLIGDRERYFIDKRYQEKGSHEFNWGETQEGRRNGKIIQKLTQHIRELEEEVLLLKRSGVIALQAGSLPRKHQEPPKKRAEES